jgi:hypothetical protein
MVNISLSITDYYSNMECRIIAVKFWLTNLWGRGEIDEILNWRIK